MKLSGVSIIRQRRVNAYHSSLPDLTDLTVLSDFGQKGAVVAHSGQVMSYLPLVLTYMSFICMFLSQEAAERRIAHNNNNGWNGIKHLQTMCLMYLIQFH